MANVKFKYDPKASVKNLESAFRLVRRNTQMQRKIKEFLERRIKGETRRAKPYNDRRTFPFLSELTVQNRAYLAKFNKTQKTFRPTGVKGRSNLTISGQLIDSITATPSLEPKKLVFSISLEGTREPYITGPGGRKAKQTDKNKTNDALFDTLKGIGYTLFSKRGLESAPEIKANVNRIFLTFLRRSLRVKNRLKG